MEMKLQIDNVKTDIRPFCLLHSTVFSMIDAVLSHEMKLFHPQQ